MFLFETYYPMVFNDLFSEITMAFQRRRAKSVGVYQFPPVGSADGVAQKLSSIMIQSKVNKKAMRKDIPVYYGIGIDCQPNIEYTSHQSERPKPVSPVQANSKRRRSSLPPTIQNDIPNAERYVSCDIRK